MELPQSIGIAGGQLSWSHYFCASQGDYLFYLDPHYPRRALPSHRDLESYTLAEIDSYHTRRLRRIHLQEMDPSMLIAFLVKDQDDWIDWRTRIEEVISAVSPGNKAKQGLFVDWKNYTRGNSYIRYRSSEES